MIVEVDRRKLQVGTRSDVSSPSQADEEKTLVPLHMWIVRILHGDLGLHDVKREGINESHHAERVVMLE